MVSVSLKMYGQVCEWRLASPTYSAVDPDGDGGLATGSVTFTLQIHTVSGSIPNVSGFSTGWSWQSTNAMLPTGSPCGSISFPLPVNITMSAAFAAFTYNFVNECSGTVNFTTGSQTFDRRSSGTVDGGFITLTTTWTDMFTVTLWTLGTVHPEAGYVVINSGNGGSPGEFSTYAVADALATEFVVNSLTYTTPLALGSGALPVTFTDFDVTCNNNGALINWSTSSESNADYFELERSINGNDWTAIGSVKAAGTTSEAQDYQLSDGFTGNALYRIKQVDFDGRAYYTSIARTNCQSNGMGMLVYPVPARDILNVVIQSDREIKTKLMVIDGAGRIVRVMDAHLFNGNNTFDINLKGLSNGAYMIRSNNPNIELSKKFSIAH